jgi:hypothetical protein
LAHSLKIPAVILPWRVIPGETHQTDFLHLDRRTYFVRDVDEILSWSVGHFKTLIDGLYCETGYNNQWMTESTFPNPTKFVDYFKAGSADSFTMQIDWALQYIDNPTLGGY